MFSLCSGRLCCYQSNHRLTCVFTIVPYIFISALLHYKFLPGDFEQYIKYAKSGVHWNNSKEYKKYVEVIGSNENFTFYDADISIKYNNSDSLSLVGVIDRMK